MGTEGIVGVVVDGHYYAHRQACDMLPNGCLSALIDEAAEITDDGQWERIVTGWTTKAWVAAEDEHVDENLRRSITHPDGDTARGGWVDSMRPRLSHRQMREDHWPTDGLDGWADRVFETPQSPGDYYRVPPIVGAPSWNVAADMPAMVKHPIELDDARYAIIADFDVDRLVCYGRVEQSVVLSVALSDSVALRRAAETARTSGNTFPLDGSDLPWRPEVRTLHGDMWHDPPIEADHDLKDGMWARPAGFSPLTGTPERYPARDAADRVCVAI